MSILSTLQDADCTTMEMHCMNVKFIGYKCECSKQQLMAVFTPFQGWGLLSHFLLFYHFFYYYQHTGYLFTITFITDRCHCSLAAVTPVKYECNPKPLTSSFIKSEINQQSFSNPHPNSGPPNNSPVIQPALYNKINGPIWMANISRMPQPLANT